MLLINGRKYATTDAEMIDSLFNDGSGTLEEAEATATRFF